MEPGDHHGRAEDQPHHEGQQPTGLLGEVDQRFEVPAHHGAERHAGDEGGDETVPLGLDGGAVGQQGQAEGGQGPKARVAPPRGVGPGRQPTADQPHAGPDAGADQEVGGGAQHRGRVDHLRGHRSGQEQIHERGGDAVVESALDVEQPADPVGDPGVLHDGRPEGRVGGGHDGTDGGRHPQRDAGDEAEGQRRPEADGQGQPDGQEADGQADVVSEFVDVDPRGVGEQDERQGDLGQRPHGRRVGIEVDEGQRTVGDDQAHDDEGDGRGDEQPLRPGRDQRPEDDAPGHGGQDHGVEAVAHRARPGPDRSAGPQSLAGAAAAAGSILHRAYCRAMDTRQRSSGEMRWSASSAPTSIWTQLTVPGKRLVDSSYSALTVDPVSLPTSVVSS